MNRLNFYLLSFLLCLPPSFMAAQGSRKQVAVGNERDDSVIYHTVERGQTIYSIAALYKVSENDIYRLNPSSREQIREGETLKIPRSGTSNASARMAEGGFVQHTIRSGETLYSLSKSYGLTPSDITAANPGLDAGTFYVGKTIRIPSSSGAAASVSTGEVYTIKKNETLYGLSRRFNTDSESLIQSRAEKRPAPGHGDQGAGEEIGHRTLHAVHTRERDKE